MRSPRQPYSKEGYRALLALAQRNGYRFASFFEEGPGGADRRIYLRHDVDYSLSMAVELAEVNHSMGVSGTFCLLLRSQMYNLLGEWAIERARRLRELGQHLALHYAPPEELPKTDQDLAASISADFEILGRNLPEVEPGFAWHNPTPELIERGRHFEVAGLVNLYGPRFIEDIGYYADSNMRHSVAEFQEIMVAGKHQELHLLFHPFNWVAGGQSMLDVLATTWKYVIMDREQELRLNRVYAAALPAGMPGAVIQAFVQRWRRAASRRGM